MASTPSLGRGLHWEGHAGHLLLSYQTKKYQNFLPIALTTLVTLQGCLELFAWPARHDTGQGVR
eukprot:1156605-Pelagomonas_calceolata.AAC.3